MRSSTITSMVETTETTTLRCVTGAKPSSALSKDVGAAIQPWTASFARFGSTLVALAVAFLLAGCMYTFNQGGGFPSHIRTLYIESFENETVEFGVGQMIDQELMAQVPRALGVQLAGREAADAIMTGRITQYSNQTQSQRVQDAGTFEIDQQQIQIAVNARIVDVGRNVILWEGQVVGQALYQPETQSEQEARAVAVTQVLQRIIDGSQSQW